MNRFFLSKEQISGDQVVFPHGVAHQILNVLRLREGERVAVLDNRGVLYQVALAVDLQAGQVTGTIRDRQHVTTEPTVQLSLCFGLSSREKVEWILQKGTEIGVSEFIPFVSSRTLVQSTGLAPQKRLRWERIIREAAEQSHRGILPVLTSPASLEACLTSVRNSLALCLVAWEGAPPLEGGIRDALAGFTGSTLGLFVGPEGGFSEGEIQLAVDAGCRVISLGPRILRLETAAIVLPALVLHELGGL